MPKIPKPNAPKLFNCERIFPGFFKYLLDSDKSMNTITGYRADLEIFCTWFKQSNGKEVTLQTITPTDVRQFRSYLMTHTKAMPATTNRKLATLHALNTWAIEEDLLSSSFMKKIEDVDQEMVAPVALDKVEENKLIREAKAIVIAATHGNANKSKSKRYVKEVARRNAIRDLSIIFFLLNTGLRVGELCDLEMGDIDLSDRKGKVIVRSGKGNKYRVVPLNKKARDAIKEWLAVRPPTLSPRVFVGARRAKDSLSTTAVYRRLVNIGHRVHVELSPHTLRHTFATRLRQDGVPINHIQKLLGHSSVDTTAREYLTVSERDLEHAVEMLE